MIVKIGKRNREIRFRMKYLAIALFLSFALVGIVYVNMDIANKGKVDDLFYYSDAETIKMYNLQKDTVKELKKQILLVKSNIDVLLSSAVDEIIEKHNLTIDKQKKEKLREYLYEKCVENFCLYFIIGGYVHIIKNETYEIEEGNKNLVGGAVQPLFSYLIRKQHEGCCKKISYIVINDMKRDFSVYGEVPEVLGISMFEYILSYFRGNV